MKLGAFIIHLARAEGRRAHVEHLRRTLPMPTAIVDAIDGALLSEAQISAVYRPKLYRPHYPFALSSSEIACFLSHRKAWQALLDSEFDAALVLEDDVEIDDQPFAVGLALARQAIGAGALVRFPYRLYSDVGVLRAQSGSIRLVVPRNVGLGMQAQLIDRAAAAKLLGATEVFDRPVDTFAQLRWLHGNRVYAVQPSIVREVGGALGGSTVQGRSRNKLERNVRRAIYKLAVAAVSRLNPPQKDP